MELVVTLFVFGAILIVAETVLPGMVAGILGGLCVLGGVIAGYVEFGPRIGNQLLIGVMIVFLGGLALWVRVFPHSRFGRVFISHGAIGGIGAEKPELLHQTGVAFTQLRPSGMALINGRRVDVVTEGNLIEKDSPIKVVALEGMRVVVRQHIPTDSAVVPHEPIHPSHPKTT